MDPDRAWKLIWTVLALIGFLLVAGCQVGKDAAIRDDRISARARGRGSGVSQGTRGGTHPAGRAGLSTR